MRVKKLTRNAEFVFRISSAGHREAEAAQLRKFRHGLLLEHAECFPLQGLLQ